MGTSRARKYARLTATGVRDGPIQRHVAPFQMQATNIVQTEQN